MARDFANAAAADPAIGLAFNTFRADVPQVKLDIDRDKVKTLGIPLKDVFDALQIYLGGFMINDFNRFGRTYKVMAQAEPEFRASPDNIGSIYVRSSGDKMIPLSNLVTVGSKTGPDLIRRHNIYRTAEINAGAGARDTAPATAWPRWSASSRRSCPRATGTSGAASRSRRRRPPGQAPMIFGMALVFVFLVLAAHVRELGHPVRHHLRSSDRGLRRLPGQSGSAGSSTTSTPRSASSCSSGSPPRTPS